MRKITPLLPLAFLLVFGLFFLPPFFAFAQNEEKDEEKPRAADSLFPMPPSLSGRLPNIENLLNQIKSNVNLQRIFCGNGVLDEGEDCRELGMLCPTGKPCNQSTCRCMDPVTCGNGAADPGEDCGEPTLPSCGGNCLQCQCIDPGGKLCTTDGDCSDGNACNGQEICLNGQCHSGTPPNCNDGNLCTSDGCNPATGQCFHDSISCPPGQSCNPSTGQCVVPQCGNGTVESPEQCDPPGQPACPANQQCQNCQCQAVAQCGDGQADPGEECGEPGLPQCPAGETCQTCQCQAGPPGSGQCGDGQADPGEECGEPGLPQCPAGQQCQNCQCQGVSKCPSFQQDLTACNPSTPLGDGTCFGTYLVFVQDAGCRQVVYQCGDPNNPNNALGICRPCVGACEPTVTPPPTCGDGIVQGPEECEADNECTGPGATCQGCKCVTPACPPGPTVKQDADGDLLFLPSTSSQGSLSATTTAVRARQEEKSAWFHKVIGWLAGKPAWAATAQKTPEEPIAPTGTTAFVTDTTPEASVTRPGTCTVSGVTGSFAVGDTLTQSGFCRGKKTGSYVVNVTCASPNPDPECQDTVTPLTINCGTGFPCEFQVTASLSQATMAQGSSNSLSLTVAQSSVFDTATCSLHSEPDNAAPELEGATVSFTPSEMSKTLSFTCGAEGSPIISYACVASCNNGKDQKSVTGQIGFTCTS